MSTFLRAALLLLVACGAPRVPAGVDAEVHQEPISNPPGAMMGTHGMTLFGGPERLYVSHIPLYEAPHAKQLVLEVKIASGVPADGLAQFQANNFTVEPERMSLADLATGRLTHFKGTIYFGNFEGGGKPLYPNVQFDVKRVVWEHALSPTMRRSPSLQYLALGTEDDGYLIHVVDAPPSFDNVLAVRGIYREGGIITIGANDIKQRFEAGQFITVVRELGCLPGPEFAGTCPEGAPPVSP